MPKLSNYLFQPNKKSTKTTERQDQQSNISKDELSKKINMLQSLAIFGDLDSSYLMPIACNIIPKTYSFGEYIVKKGEIPDGLFIINSG
jgi:hypothetical protein